MPVKRLPPNIDASDNPLFPPIFDDPLQYVDTAESLVPFTQINPPPLTWLWHNIIPIGSLTLLDAPASLGKSTRLLDLAARLSSSLPLPDLATGHLPTPSAFAPANPMPIVLITPDDPTNARSHAFFSHTSSRPKGLYSFTNLTLSHIHSGDRYTRPFRFTSTDLDILTRELPALRPKLVIIDPFTSTLDTDPPMKETTLVTLLARLHTLAATLQFACILVRTTPDRPSQGTRLQRSIQPLLKSATAFTLVPDPLFPDHTLLVQTKATFAQPAPILRFHLAPHPTNPAIPSIAWDGLSDLTRSELAAALALPTSTLSPTRRIICDFLAQQPEPVALPALAEALPTLSYDLLRRTLRRMVNDYQIANPARGLYSTFSHQPDSSSPIITQLPETSSPSTSPTTDTHSSSSTSPDPDVPSSLPPSLSPNPVPTVTFPPEAPSDPLYSQMPSSPLSPKVVTSDPPTVSSITLPGYQSLLPDTFFHQSYPLSPTSESPSRPQFPSSISEPTSHQTQPSSPTLETSSQNTSPSSQETVPTVTSTPTVIASTTYSSLHFLSSPPTTHRASINSCSDLPDHPPLNAQTTHLDS
jgi:hypothetical protein